MHGIEHIIRNAFLLQQASNSVASDNSGILQALFEEIVAELIQLDPTGVQPRYRRDRIAKLIRRVEKLAPEAYAEWGKNVRNDLARLGVVQGQQAYLQLIATLGQAPDLVNRAGPSLNLMKSIIDGRIFEGDLFSEWTKNEARDVVKAFRREVRMGMAREETIDQLVRRIRGRSNGRGGFTGGVMNTTTRKAANLVRTAVTGIANDAHMEVYRANAHVIEALDWIYALDSFTCPTCIARGDAGPYKLDDTSAPKPPAHWSCRCVLTARVNHEKVGVDVGDDIGTRAARNAQGKSVQVPANTTFDAWLKSMPKSVQEDVLGVGRARLFRSGKYSLADLIRRDGRFVTLDQLERMAA